MTGQMHWVGDATHSVARGNERLMAGLETFLEECCFFMAPWDKDEESEDSKVEVDPEEVEQEVQGLHEEQENPGSSVPEYMVWSSVCLSEGRGQKNQQPTPNDNKNKWWSSSAVLVYDLHRGMCCKPSGKVQEGREGLLMGNICDW